MSGNWNGRAGSAEHSARRPSPDWVMDVCCNSFTGRTLDCSGHSSEGIDSCKDVFEIRCGTEEGERPVRRISDSSPSTATAVHSMGGYGWDCVDLGGCAQCKGQLNDSMILYAMGFKFCSVSCFPMGLEYFPCPCFKISRSANLSLCLLRDPPLYRRGSPFLKKPFPSAPARIAQRVDGTTVKCRLHLRQPCQTFSSRIRLRAKQTCAWGIFSLPALPPPFVFLGSHARKKAMQRAPSLGTIAPYE